jgi:lipooligosaccharide transport system permease protein
VSAPQGGAKALADTDYAAEAMAAGARVRRYGSWYAAEHRLREMRAFALTLVVLMFGNPLLYLLSLGLGLATLVSADVNGVSYLVFVAPALLAGAAFMAGAEESTYPVLVGFKFKPIFFAMAASPISPRQVANGIFIGTAVRVIPTVIVYYFIMVMFNAVPSAAGIATITTASLLGMAVATPVTWYTATVEEDKGQMATIMRFVIMPLFLFSGTFFPLEQLPIFLQWIGWISPLWHGTQLGRVLSYGLSEPIWLTVGHVVFLVALLVIGWRGTYRVVTKRLNK